MPETLTAGMPSNDPPLSYNHGNTDSIGFLDKNHLCYLLETHRFVTKQWFAVSIPIAQELPQSCIVCEMGKNYATAQDAAAHLFARKHESACGVGSSGDEFRSAFTYWMEVTQQVGVSDWNYSLEGPQNTANPKHQQTLPSMPGLPKALYSWRYHNFISCDLPQIVEIAGKS
jgi:hypothetical protein